MICSFCNYSEATHHCTTSNKKGGKPRCRECYERAVLAESLIFDMPMSDNKFRRHKFLNSDCKGIDRGFTRV